MLRQNKSALDEEIASALYKWRMAAAYYESAKDGDLMEYAIYGGGKAPLHISSQAKAKRRVTGAIPGERGNMSVIIALLLGFGILWLACKVLKISLKIFWKLFVNALIGAAILLIINFFGTVIGISISISFLSALIVGILGVPGVIILLLLQLF